MLIKIKDSWVDIAALDYVLGLDPDETGPGGTTHFKGEPGFVRFDTEDGQPVLVNSRMVVELRAEDGATELESTRGRKLLISGKPEWVAGLLNKARRLVA